MIRRFTHLSDTHGTWPGIFSEYFPIPEDSEFVVHAGDFAPNNPNLERKLRKSVQLSQEVSHQELWLKDKAEALANELKGRPLIFIRGNHDFFHPIQILRDHGINAYCVENELVEVNGIKFYGVPHIPFIEGHWNFERRSPEMKEIVSKIPECDILITHCPPAGILCGSDSGKDGNSHLTNFLSYNPNAENLKFLLCGHFHESRGIRTLNNLVVSNAATTMHTFEMEY